MERYRKLLKQCGIDTYAVQEVQKDIVELFFIKKKLDMRRIEKTKEVSFSVYKDMEIGDKKLRGSAEVVANASMSDEEILEKIKSADYSAQFVKNPFFTLPGKEVSEEVVQESTLNGKSLSEIADRFVDAVYSVDTDKEAFVNNLELFTEERHVRIITSEGTDVSYVKRSVSGEFVAQCKTPQDVETFQNFDFDTLALDDMKALVERTLSMTKDRAKAERMPKAGTYDVIISDRYMKEMLSFYVGRADAGMIYPGYSNYKAGDNVQGEAVGDILNVKLGADVPFNYEGIRMVERPLLENGVLKTIHGNQRFSYYLGVPQIGSYSKVIVPAGKLSFDELKDRPCLHVVNFSDFQMDEMDGHFAGEIRLAYVYDGKGNVECVTGGSINGNIMTAQKDMYFSKETQSLAGYEGPRAILLKGVKVAGEN